MRQITEYAVKVFLNKDNSTINLSNTRVSFDKESSGKGLFLHDNLIAIHNIKTGKIQISNAGWKSSTTKERLNGVLTLLTGKAGIFQKNFVWYLDINNKIIEFPHDRFVDIN